MLLPLIAAVAACTPSPQDSAMQKPGNGAESANQFAGVATSAQPDSATLGPIPEAVSAAENPLPRTPDTPTEAQGRRTLSTAFVQIGADGHLTVNLRNGTQMVLRNVVMRAKEYCGVQAFGAAAGKTYCGGYAEVAAARPGGGPVPR